MIDTKIQFVLIIQSDVVSTVINGSSRTVFLETF